MLATLLARSRNNWFRPLHLPSGRFQGGVGGVGFVLTSYLLKLESQSVNAASEQSFNDLSHFELPCLVLPEVKGKGKVDEELRDDQDGGKPAGHSRAPEGR